MNQVMELTSFLRTLPDMTLVVMQREAREVGDLNLKNLVLAELGRREKERRGDMEIEDED